VFVGIYNIYIISATGQCISDFKKLLYNICSEDVEELKREMQRTEVDLRKEVKIAVICFVNSSLP